MDLPHPVWSDINHFNSDVQLLYLEHVSLAVGIPFLPHLDAQIRYLRFGRHHIVFSTSDSLTVKCHTAVPVDVMIWQKKETELNFRISACVPYSSHSLRPSVGPVSQIFTWIVLLESRFT